jgi:hypothetical protein
VNDPFYPVGGLVMKALLLKTSPYQLLMETWITEDDPILIGKKI